MPMGEKEIGDVGWLQATILQPLEEHGTHAERARVDQRRTCVRAQEHHRAPAEPAVADRLAGEALHHDVDIVIPDFHGWPSGALKTGKSGRPALSASFCIAATSLA